MIGIIAGSCADELQGNIAAEAFVACPVNLAHGAGPDLLEDFVMSYDTPIHALKSRWHVRGTICSSQQWSGEMGPEGVKRGACSVALGCLLSISRADAYGRVGVSVRLQICRGCL